MPKYAILGHFRNFQRLFNPFRTIRFSKIQHFFKLFSITLNLHRSAKNGPRNLKPGSIDAEFNVDVENDLISKPILSSS